VLGVTDGRRARRTSRRTERGHALVEFALAAPMLVVFLLGMVILGNVVLNQIELTNTARDGARAAALCGGTGFQAGSTSTLPNGQACTEPNLVTFIQGRLQTIPGVTPSVTVIVNGSPDTDLAHCQKGRTISVTASYAQPIYVPLVGRWLGDPGNAAIRTLNATAEATCEQ
jgi:Flp pilus assembly protein TadG